MSILAAGEGRISGDDYLPCRADEVFWGRLPCGGDAPVLSVTAGTTVTIDTLSHEGVLEDQGSDPLAYFGSHGVAGEDVLLEAVRLVQTRRREAADGPHVITGPIEVPGAKPGDLIAVTLLETERRVPYGVISNRHGRGALPGEMPLGVEAYSAFVSVEEREDGAYGVLPRRLGEAATVRFPLRPFLGIIGVASAGPERLHSVPPGPHGGNLDINDLVVGSTLYIPVQVAGALVYVGDPHFAQGNGEVALTAVEASLRATVRLDIVPAGEAAALFGELAGPIAETQDYLIPTGLDESLDIAMQNCVRAALSLLEVRYGMDRGQAYAYLSAATDFEISQVVDLVKGVHARIRKADFA